MLSKFVHTQTPIHETQLLMPMKCCYAYPLQFFCLSKLCHLKELFRKAWLKLNVTLKFHAYLCTTMLMWSGPLELQLKFDSLDSHLYPLAKRFIANFNKLGFFSSLKEHTISLLSSMPVLSIFFGSQQHRATVKLDLQVHPMCWIAWDDKMQDNIPAGQNRNNYLT